MLDNTVEGVYIPPRTVQPHTATGPPRGRSSRPQKVKKATTEPHPYFVVPRGVSRGMVDTDTIPVLTVKLRLPTKARPGLQTVQRASAGGQQGSAKRAKQASIDEMVGKRIRVLWPDERQFFSGTVTAFSPDSVRTLQCRHDGFRTQTTHSAKIGMVSKCAGYA